MAVGMLKHHPRRHIDHRIPLPDNHIWFQASIIRMPFQRSAVNTIHSER